MHVYTHFTDFHVCLYSNSYIYCTYKKQTNANTHAHSNTVHILSGGMKLDLQLNNSSQQITMSSCRKGKKTEHMLVDSCIGYKEMLSYHKCS